MCGESECAADGRVVQVSGGAVELMGERLGYGAPLD